MRCALRVLTLALAAGIVSPLHAQEPKPPELTPEERQKLAISAIKLNPEGVEPNQQGKYAEAVRKLDQTLAIRRTLFPVSSYPDGHPSLVHSLINLAYPLHAQGALDKAVTCYEQALAMNRKLYPE